MENIFKIFLSFKKSFFLQNIILIKVLIAPGPNVLKYLFVMFNKLELLFIIHISALE